MNSLLIEKLPIWIYEYNNVFPILAENFVQFLIWVNILHMKSRSGWSSYEAHFPVKAICKFSSWKFLHFPEICQKADVMNDDKLAKNYDWWWIGLNWFFLLIYWHSFRIEGYFLWVYDFFSPSDWHATDLVVFEIFNFIFFPQFEYMLVISFLRVIIEKWQT